MFIPKKSLCFLLGRIFEVIKEPICLEGRSHSVAPVKVEIRSTHGNRWKSPLRQRLSIARAVILKPQILVLDEVGETSHQSPSTFQGKLTYPKINVLNLPVNMMFGVWGFCHPKLCTWDSPKEGSDTLDFLFRLGSCSNSFPSMSWFWSCVFLRVPNQCSSYVITLTCSWRCHREIYISFPSAVVITKLNLLSVLEPDNLHLEKDVSMLIKVLSIVWVLRCCRHTFK